MVDEGIATTRVVLPSGELREYASPGHSGNGPGGGRRPGFVVHLLRGQDGIQGVMVITAVGPSEELQPAQIYFVLPIEMQGCHLTRDEVAALAVKASSALVKVTAKPAFAQPSSLCGERTSTTLSFSWC